LRAASTKFIRRKAPNKAKKKELYEMSEEDGENVKEIPETLYSKLLVFTIQSDK